MKRTKLQKLFIQDSKGRKHYALLRGRIWKAAAAIMSDDLASSVVRTWERRQEGVKWS